jgi:WD40 repeat protein
MRILRGHTAPVLCLAHAPDGRTLASGDAGGGILLWDLGGEGVSHLDAFHPGAVLSLAWDPAGRQLATSQSDGVYIRDLERRRWEGRAGGLPGSCVFAFAADGKTLYWTTYLSDRIYSFEVGAGQPDQIFQGHEAGILSLACSPTEDCLVTGGGQPGLGELLYWEPGRINGIHVEEPDGPPRQAIYSVTFSPDGRRIAEGGRDRRVSVWDVSNLRRQAVFAGHRGTVVAVCFTPDGRTLLSADDAGLICLWDLATERQRAALDWGIGRLRCVTISPDGMTAAAGGADHSVLVWDLD